MKSLIIAEKPSVAKDIAQALGVARVGKHYESDTLVVSYCVGHLVEIHVPEAHDRTLLPIIPEQFSLQVIADRADQFRNLKELMARPDISTIVNACDAGREGESIYRLVLEAAKCKKNSERMWLQTMTSSGIIKAWDGRVPSQQYDSLGQAARSRMESDWLFGINGSRASFSAVGRVMTPTLAMITKAYIAHRDFVSTNYWELTGEFLIKGGKYKANLGVGMENSSTFETKRFTQENLAQAAAKALEGHHPSDIQDECKTVRSAAPALFDLTTLQREANKRFKFSASKTLEIAQKLYESHKSISYPRTDSQALPEDYVKKCEQVVRLLAKAYPDLNPLCNAILNQGWVVPTKKIFNNEKISDHFAIIPTGVISNEMTSEEAQIYQLICKRFIAVFYPESVFAQTIRSTTVNDQLFRVSGKVMTQAGWREVYGAEVEEEAELSLPPLIPGETGLTKSFEVRACKTKAPALLNESSLLRAMETAGKSIEDGDLADVMKERGLGTPATRAATIEKLKDTRGFQGKKKEPFVTLQKNFLIPSDKGLRLIAYLEKTYPKLTQPQLTGELEYQLRLMEKSQLSRDTYMTRVRQAVLEMVQTLQEQPPLRSTAHDSSGLISQLGCCPLCKKGLQDKPLLLVCDCGFKLWKSVAGKKIADKFMKQILQYGHTEVLEGFKSKAGKSFKAKLKIDPEKKEVTFDFHF